ncbi:hypothetical protein OMW55_12440 [Sphingomonas sp. BN140010]|uniref:Pectate lyase superfamily protein domain-containing protein n=1 Tax=Sphingomonas arvum TaxID=2992113 RepID=A0ABT3JHT1_9SPHN|nr:hypothetical protein [Sphingomonas sp. BN140010]MCW3798615.1 hypothetical protein [Sphingomonas sp. BN140010]
MPAVFTPRFVDLVRTYTTTQGTGPVVPGAAVQGFSSFAEALNFGDQFYYCMQGIDHPSEREVGRGSFQADGTITRQPVSGTATDFSSGAKTISLVTAAEWFTQQQSAIGTATPGAVVSIATRAELSEAGGGSPGNGSVRWLREGGREGLFVFDSSDLSAKVTADPRQGVCVAPAGDPTGAAGCWMRKVDGPFNVRWFGAVGDYVADDLPAFVACRDFILSQTQGVFAGNHVMFVPSGRYFLADRFDSNGLRLVGEHSGQPGGASTVLRAAKNKTCVRLTGGPNNASSSLENVQLVGGNVTVTSSGSVTSYAAGNSPTGNGVELAVDWATCINVSAVCFGGTGFVANSDLRAGNCNSFYLERCQSMYNRGDGYLFAGTDANAGTTINCSSISNGGAGFREYTFLGNTHIAPHVRDCGVVDATGCNGPVGTCKHGTTPARYFYVVAGREAQAATEVPGSVSNGAEAWREFSGHPSCKVWTAGQTWTSASPYQTNPANVNARNSFVGCYAESAQAPVQATAPSIFSGGLLDEVGFDKDSSASWLRAGTVEQKAALVVPGFMAMQNGSAELASLPIAAVSRPWNVLQPGPQQGSVHLRHSCIAGQGTALTFGYAGGGGMSAGAGVYSHSYPTSGSRLSLATTDNFGMGAQTALTIDEWGNVDAVRGSLKGHCPVTVQSGAAYTAVAGDRDSYVRFTSNSAVTFTIPPNSVAAMPLGAEITMEQGGSGSVTPTPGPGVIINKRGAVSATAGQFAVATLKKVGADVWTLTGDLA